MTELEQGVFVLRADSSDWVPDDEDGGMMQVLYEEGEGSVGLWNPGEEDRIEGGALPTRETAVVLRGSVRIEIENGPSLELNAGDVASLPPGSTATWYPSRDFLKVWMTA